MDVGDLVRIKYSHYSPFYIRPDVGEIGIIVEVSKSSSLGVIYFVQTSDGIWKFSDYEVEPFDGGR
tara:strand:+ start:5104 stop:5301 length:198 start_codon:yes stop_codon:yes gene_type:complete